MLIERAAYLASHARASVPYYLHEELGYNYRMSPLTAAYSLLQLGRLAELLQVRKTLDDSYRMLGGTSGFRFQSPGPGVEFQPWITACLLPSTSDPAFVLEHLLTNGIESRRLWKPMHQQPLFKSAPFYGSGVSEQLFASGLCLPSGSNMTIEALKHVTEIVLREVSS